MVTLVSKQKETIQNIYPSDATPVALKMQSAVGYSISANLSANIGTVWVTNGIFIGQIAEVEGTQFAVQSDLPEILVTTSPVTVRGNRVIFDTKQMDVGKPYRYKDNNKPYIAIKNRDNSIDIFRIHRR